MGSQAGSEKGRQVKVNKAVRGTALTALMAMGMLAGRSAPSVSIKFGRRGSYTDPNRPGKLRRRKHGNYFVYFWQ